MNQINKQLSSMKRISFIVMAFALVMSLSQCKKEQTSPNNTTESVMITLDVKGGNGSRVDVDPNIGTVNFENGDKLYVASAGKYVGTLTHNGTYFVGTVTNAVADSLLRFYFLGNVEPSEALVAGSTTSCSVDISDQSENYSNNQWDLPVISFGSSNEPFGQQTFYTAYLRNKCALVKFRVYQGVQSNDDVYISGVNHVVTIGFDGDSFEYGKYNEGYINLGQGSHNSWVEKWVILLPQEAMEGADDGAYINNVYYGYRGAIPAISPNAFFTNGIEVLINDESVVPTPTGAMSGLFSINNTEKVWFSQGNLQYQQSNNTWHFAENQWDYSGVSNYDLFAWETALEDHIISNGNAGDIWRNLTYAGWTYITHYRETPSGVRYAKANVEGVNGLLLFPDDWKSSVYRVVNENTIAAPYSSNVINSDTRAILEANGVVFLPVVGQSGKYWTSSSTSVSNRAYSLDITNNNLSYGYTGVMSSLFIRLVQDYIPAK